MYKSSFVPFIYVLCINKLQKSYEEMWSTLKEKELKLNPKLVIVDFGCAAITAVKKHFSKLKSIHVFSIWGKMNGDTYKIVDFKVNIVRI